MSKRFTVTLSLQDAAELTRGVELLRATREALCIDCSGLKAMWSRVAGQITIEHETRARKPGPKTARA